MALEAGKVRNVGIVGHSGAGKTSLVEQVLSDMGVTSRRGRIEDGNTVPDFLEEEVQHGHSIQLSPVHFEHDGMRIHLVDHPGYADFLGELAASAPVLDAMVIVVDASTGIQIGTDNAFRYAEKYHVPRAFFINKLEREHTDFDELVNMLRATYGTQVAPLVAPVGQAHEFSNVVNVLEADGLDETQQAMKLELMDAVAESNDALLEKYLDAGTLSPEELREGMRAGIAEGKLIPVIAGSADKDLGVRELIGLIATCFPSPLDRKVIAIDNNDKPVEVPVDPNGPFLAQVFRQVVDPFVGHLTMFRVFSGTLKSDGEFYNVTTRSKERTGKILLLKGKDNVQVDCAGPGDIAAVTKLKNTRFGDTLGIQSTEVSLPMIEMPTPLVKLAIRPKSRADEDKIGEALNRLAEEDPTFKHYRDQDTHEHVIRGMGDLQLEILLERMRNKYHVEAETSTPRVAYRETIKATAEAQGRHKKQTGGHGQFGDVHLRIAPNTRGAGYEFIDSIVGGVVPRQYIPAVDKGCIEALAKGIISGHPVVDIKVELFYGSYHSVDSSELAFKIAASLALQKAFKEARPCILEPIMEIAITIPDEFMGDINGDLNSRRGRILGMDPAGPGRQCIRATVPEAEVLRYSADLRSMTGGRGTYDLKFSHFEEVPEHLAKEIIAAYEKAREEGKD
ncbi:MAG: elongation factor G [Candidatus Hydrogenedentes bacterium]|nr:elongation factor G [Candidatus Hydrogenedentota bacterium]